MLCFIEEVREIQPAAETKQDFSWSVDRNETFVLFYDGQKVLTSSGLFYYNHSNIVHGKDCCNLALYFSYLYTAKPAIFSKVYNDNLFSPHSVTVPEM